MPSIPLKVTRAPGGDGDPATQRTGKPLFRGNGDTDYVCGHCGSVIAAGMAPTERVMVDATVCSGCGAEIEFPADLRA